jgi:sodium pump decarboxylase gamma subunit
MQEGLVVLVIGMSTVLAFLFLLVFLIYGMGLFVARFVPPSQRTASIPLPPSDESLVVAIAAARRARG